MSDTGGAGSALTDAALIGRSVDDPQSFSIIVERHATAVFRYLVSRVARSAADDLLADVFETAFGARGRYDSRYDSALPWLLGIATNEIRHYRRSEVRHASMLRRITPHSTPGNGNLDAMDATAIDAEAHEEMESVRRAMAALDDGHREILVLCAGLGLSYEEIAHTLGIRIGTVRSRLSRARQKLRELMEADGQYRTNDDSLRRDSVSEEHPK